MCLVKQLVNQQLPPERLIDKIFLRGNRVKITQGDCSLFVWHDLHLEGRHQTGKTLEVLVFIVCNGSCYFIQASYTLTHLTGESFTSSVGCQAGSHMNDRGSTNVWFLQFGRIHPDLARNIDGEKMSITSNRGLCIC